MFLAVTVRSPTWTVRASLKLAAPLIHSALYFLNSISMPPVSSLTALSFSARMASKSSFTPSKLMPNFARSPLLACSYISDAWSNAFDGMQPTLRQVPPSVPRFSTQAVLRPSCAARIAAT